MKRAFVGFACAAALLAAVGESAAQTGLPLSAELRLDAGIPVGDSGDGLSAGVGFGVNAAFHIAPTLAIYGGWSRFQFDADALLGTTRVEDEGFAVGGKLILSPGVAISSPFVSFGALFRGGDTGLEAALGADYPVTYALAVTPMVRYRTVGGLDYLTLGAGVQFRF